jgi:hypothetical protein
MPRYTFKLKDDESGVEDENGVDLPSQQVAYCYARDVVYELMYRRELHTRHWQLEVYEDNDEKVFEIPFASLDPTLDHLTHEQRALVEHGARQIGAVKEAFYALSLTRQETHALIALSRGEPYLAARAGRKIIRDD